MANALSDNQTRSLGFSNAPVYDRRDLGQVGRGTADSYLSAIMAAPEWLLAKMLKDDPYQKGVLQSGPQDRMKAEQRRWEEYQADQAQNRDYAQGQDYGTGLAMVADPFLDALGAIPAVGKALKLKAPARSGKPVNALSDLFKDEAGAIRAYHGTKKEIIGDINTTTNGAVEGVYLAKDPNHAGVFAQGEGGAIYPVDIDESLNIGKRQDMIDAFTDGSTPASRRKTMEAKGLDGYFDENHGEMIIFDKKNIKSPFKTNS